MDEVDIYTDGACKGNPGTGGWGTLLYCRGHSRELCGGARNVTNNQMELTAVIKGLEALKRPCIVRVFSDSTYVINGMKSWVKKWQKKDWKRGKNGEGEIKNLALWKRIVELSDVHEVSWHWVRGHDGCAGNERADELANIGVLKIQS